MRVWRPSIAKVLLCTAVVGLLATAAVAESYPEKPIRWVLGFPAGGASDVLARVIAQELEKVVGQQVVIENKPGASGIIAAGAVSQAAADGYTILLVSSSYINNIALGKKFTFEPIDDFEMVTRVAIVPNVVVVPPSLPVKSIADLVKLARSKPGQLNFASGGVGTGTHIATELFKSMTGVEMTHVPYKGTPPALLDLMAGRVQVMFAGMPPTLPHIKEGKLRAIAVTSGNRSEQLPDVPTVAETVPDYEAVTWYGVFAPRRTPKPVIEKLNAAFRTALRSREVKARLADQGFEPSPSSPEELRAYIDRAIARTSKVVKEAGITELN